MAEEKQNHQIRPAARIIDTLGKGLIKDDLAAIIELVKNSYDADSSDVYIKFEFEKEKNILTIRVWDHGHGMGYDTVVNKWLVPGTSDKLDRKRSPKKKRQLQGRKGIGRYAAGILGQELLLSTVDENGQKTELIMDWDGISNHTYLDEVEILVESGQTKERNGTLIEIQNNLDKVEPRKKITEIWPDNKIEKLRTELRKMLSPLTDRQKDEFSISLEFGEFPSDAFNNVKLPIEPLPLLNMYDYRVFGHITKSGIANITYENQCVKPVEIEQLKLSIKIEDDELRGYSCGEIKFDLRVFDRDPEAIDEIVKRVKLQHNLDMGKNEVKRWLNDFNGAGIYRGGFRIRPYGDKEYDWLNLGARRVDIPVKRIGSNQIIGLIDIETEEKSGLEEKSARDGLVENPQFRLLQDRIYGVLEPLEQRRYKFRVASGRGRKLVNIERALESLFDFETIALYVSKRLKRLKVAENEISLIVQKIEDVKEQKAKDLADIKETIAYYQGQANLGKMVGHILHEGRKPIGYLRNALPNLDRFLKKLERDTSDKTALGEMQSEIPYLKDQTEHIYELFSKLDPFTYKKNERARAHKLIAVIQNAIRLFKHDLDEKNIRVQIDIKKTADVYGRATDLGWIFTNIFENSLFWLEQNEESEKLISISAEERKSYQHIEILDSGPGTTTELLENGKLFEPGISLKKGGTGMGLALVGELVKRNKGEVWSPEIKNGMKICLRLPATKEISDES